MAITFDQLLKNTGAKPSDVKVISSFNSKTPVEQPNQPIAPSITPETTQQSTNPLSPLINKYKSNVDAAGNTIAETYKANAQDVIANTKRLVVGDNGPGQVDESTFNLGQKVANRLVAGTHIVGDIASVVFTPLIEGLKIFIPEQIKNDSTKAAEYVGNKINEIPGATTLLNHVNDKWDSLDSDTKQVIAKDLPSILSVLGASETNPLNPNIPKISTVVNDAKTTVNSVVKPITEKINSITAPKAEPVAVKPTATPEKIKIDLQKTIEDTMPFQDKNVRIDELRNTFPDSGNGAGGVTREGILGKSTPQPTAVDIERGTIANEYIKGAKDPVVKIQNVNQGIRDISQKVVDPFLEKNAAPANFEDMRTYLEQNNKPTPSLQKDPGAFDAYTRSTDKALETLNKVMKDSAKSSGDYGPKTSGVDIRNARIAIDKEISAELGQETFGTPQFKGIKAAEINIRNVLNRLNEDLLRYPGQLEKLNKLTEFVESSRSRGIEIDLNNPQVRAGLEKQFGLESTPQSEANAKFLADQHAKMSHLFDARDNMIDKYQANVGKTKFQEFLKSPLGKNVIKGAKIIGIGSGAIGAAELLK